MKSTWLTVGLGLLNIALLTSNGFLLHAVGLLKDDGLLASLAELELERVALAGERLRLVDAISAAKSLVAELRSAGSERNVRLGQASAFRPEVESELDEIAARFGSTRRPDPHEIPRMDAEELAELDRRRSDMPRELSAALLLSADIDQILEDSLWNPNGRQLTEPARRVLAELLSEYRYFARVSKVERFRNYVEKEIPRLREAGAYVEYPKDEAPPAPPGIFMSHAESSDRQGYRRIYYFPEEDYPEMAHQRRVEDERGLETFVMVYDLINSTPPAEAPR
jgi:hypothetical protein